MLNKAHFKALGFVGLLTIVLVFGLPRQTAAQFKLAIGSLFLPLFGLSRTANHLTREAGDALVSRGELLRLNEALRHTNAVLQLQGQQLAAVIAENDRLRAYYNWQRTTLWKDRLRLARVVARDPANWWQTISIDLGSLQGMREDLPVLSQEGLVGRIKSVSLTRSQVVLISDPGCKVSAAIEGTRELGVITGSASPINHTLVRLSHLASTTVIKPGQTVRTSGSGGVFPAGIHIGKIAEDPQAVYFGQSSEARVKLGADLNALDEVWVLTMP